MLDANTIYPAAALGAGMLAIVNLLKVSSTSKITVMDTANVQMFVIGR